MMEGWFQVSGFRDQKRRERDAVAEAVAPSGLKMIWAGIQGLAALAIGRTALRA